MPQREGSQPGNPSQACPSAPGEMPVASLNKPLWYQYCCNCWGALRLFPFSSRLHSEEPVCQSFLAPVAAQDHEMAVTKMNKEPQRWRGADGHGRRSEGGRIQVLDCQAGILPHLGTPPLPWLSPSGALWGHSAHGWDTDNTLGITHHLQVALLHSLPRQGSSGGAGRVTQKVTKSRLGTGTQRGIIFLLVVAPALGIYNLLSCTEC